MKKRAKKRYIKTMQVIGRNVVIPMYDKYDGKRKELSEWRDGIVIGFILWTLIIIMALFF